MCNMFYKSAHTGNHPTIAACLTDIDRCIVNKCSPVWGGLVKYLTLRDDRNCHPNLLHCGVITHLGSFYVGDLELVHSQQLQPNLLFFIHFVLLSNFFKKYKVNWSGQNDVILIFKVAAIYSIADTKHGAASSRQQLRQQ